jgi:SAM-dependent methyltransferase
MGKIAVAHPGLMGDALYILPATRWLCNKLGCKADFYTSTHCRSIGDLVEYQPYIDKFVVLENYIATGNGPGLQPFAMPVPDQGYEMVYQLGYRSNPDRFLVNWTAMQIGAPHGLPVRYDFPDTGIRVGLPDEYIIMAPRKARNTTYLDLFQEIIDRSTVPVVQVGGRADGLDGGLDLCGLAGMLETVDLLSQATAFVGLMSSNLVLANGFPWMQKYVPHDGRSWDMRHVLYSSNNHYMIDPTPDEILGRIGANMKTYSKCLEPDDHVTEMDHIKNMQDVMRGSYVRFEHEHRKWEYGLALSALRRARVRTVLDAGGGASIFAPAAAWSDIGIHVTQVDPGDFASWIESQRQIVPDVGPYIQRDFMDWEDETAYDAVTCLSVLEHVEDDIAFFKKLLPHVKPGGVLFVTVDFHPSGEAQVGGHLRTYNKDRLSVLSGIARKAGFKNYLGKSSWNYDGEHVNNYNFASLCMRRSR